MEWHPLGHVEDLYTEGDNFNNPVRLIRFDVEEGIVESGADDCSLIRSVYSAFDHNPTRMMRTSVEPLPDHVDVIVGHSLVSSTAAVRLRDQLYPNAKVITTLSLLLFHRRTRASYVYNGCLAWYNVVLTPRVYSCVKFVGLPLATRATVEQVC